MKNNIKKDLILIIIIFLLSRLLFFLFLIKNQSLSFTVIYDAENYINIAKNGYNQDLLYAFFPLFPLLIRLFHYIIPSYEITALLLSNIFSFLSTIVLYKLVENNKNKDFILIAYIFSPILLYNSIGYTESLYLLLTISSFYYYKKEKIFLSSTLASLSIITRNTGLVLVVAISLDILYKILKKEKKIKDLLLFLIIPIITGLSYHIYLYIMTGDFFKYITVQFTYWSRGRCNLITLFIKDIKYIKEISNKGELYPLIQNWFFYFMGLFYALKYIKKEKVLSLYVIISSLLFVTTYRDSYLFTLPSVSLFRYVFSLFPMYLLPFMKDKKITNILQISLYVVLAIINTLLLFDLGIFLA